MDAQAMTKLYLAELDLLLHGASAGAWLVVGALIGALHFLTLRWNVAMLALDRPLPLVLAIALVRVALIAGALGVVAGRFGALPLIVATAGILAARTAVIRLG
jgi:F1F0 ATPase subunit 2